MAEKLGAERDGIARTAIGRVFDCAHEHGCEGIQVVLHQVHRAGYWTVTLSWVVVLHGKSKRNVKYAWKGVWE